MTSLPSSASTLFHTPPLQGKDRQAVVMKAMERFPKKLNTTETTHDFLSHLFSPASKRWLYKGNGKSGTTSTKSFLFWLEFGVPISTVVDNPNDLNPDSYAHRLAPAGVFRSLLQIGEGVDLFKTALKLTTVRHPTQRAVTSFRYICASHDQHHIWFSSERLRMNAAVGFDWDNDPYTVRGFEKFLEYVEYEKTNGPVSAINPHWRPQRANVLPHVFKPDIIGKVENLEAFFREIAERFDTPLPSDWVAPHANKSQNKNNTEALLSPNSLALIQRVYAADFEAFNYDP